MAHRPMPKPDPAGRLFPVEASPAPNRPQTSGASDISEPGKARHSRYAWEIIFSVLVIAATLFVGWRIGEIVWARAEHINSGPSQVNPIPATSPPSISSDGPRHPLEAKSTRRDAQLTGPTADEPVVIRAIVGVDGRVKQARVLRGNAKLAPAALQTVQQLSFNPYAPHGTPVEFETEVVVSRPGARKDGNKNLQISIPQQPITQP